MVKIAGFGNPLLDITAKLDNDHLLKKYNLHEDEQAEISKSLLKTLIDEISEFDLSYSPGGSAQNTLRLLQWLLKAPNSIFMFGGIGNDDQGKNLKRLIENSGVITKYTTSKGEPTGTVVALTKNHNRSLVANIGAAEHVSIEDLKEFEFLLKNVDHFYMEGFFITKRESVAKYIQRFCEKNNKTFIFNLSAPYIVQENPEVVAYLASKSDILFGNKKEFQALKDLIKFKGTPQELTLHLLEDNKKNENSKREKMVIITNGSRWVICAHGNNVIEKMEVPKIGDDKIVDTTGAGDAFSAGFLAGVFNGKHPKDCLKLGFWTAAQIIQQAGCSIPPISVNIDDILSNKH